MSDRSNIPAIIELRLRASAQDLMAAVAVHSDELLDAVERAARADVIAAVLGEEITKGLEKAIRSEVSNFFAYGQGQTFVREAVAAGLKAMVAKL